MAQFDKILIANRGEIAVRLIRACRELGVKTVAVYSEADRASYHVRLADEAIEIGPAPALESYLCAKRILEAANYSGAQAIHPGYGFLSENATFARQVEEAGLVFIGPPPEAIFAMGDKAEARQRMIAAGIPVVPGRQNLEGVQAFVQAAEEIGYPVMIKAATGGGGKGMRIVLQPGELLEAAAAARRESRHAFGDDRLILEAYIPQARHIEFQVLADQYGNIVHLFERECSVQRRHQKIIEETPSPLLTPEFRAKMGEAAVNAAKAVGYFNAGTVEFIFDPIHLKYYFLEMNTRLQVEHPITELVAGVDLVQWQIRIAAGEKFPFTQSDFHQHGHAIECRIYAEDPANGFLPSTGQLLQFIQPHGPGIRVDSGFAVGSDVTHFYDPLLAKLIVHAESRDAALERMKTALKDFVVHGVVTNIDFMRAVLETDDFKTGKVSTRWVESKFNEWTPVQPGLPILIAAALADVVFASGKAQPAVSNETDPFNPWKQTGNFRV